MTNDPNQPTPPPQMPQTSQETGKLIIDTRRGRCASCGSTNISETRVRSGDAKAWNGAMGCIGIIIGCVTCGLGFLLPLVAKKKESYEIYRSCVDCGHKWRV